MEKVVKLDNDLRKRILEFLYYDEVFNAILIEQIQNNTENLGELYINNENGKINSILYIKNDGNSDLTNFSCASNVGLMNIADQIRKLDYRKMLLAGKFNDVKILLDMLGYSKNIEPNIFYKLNVEKYKKPVNLKSTIRLACISEKDIEMVKRFTALFLEAKTEEEYESVTDDDKIRVKMKSGVYILEYEGNPVGMARFIGKTSNFSEITSVYIDEAYRNRGLGKELIAHMIEIALQEKRTPVLATSEDNIPARKTYESTGFEKLGAYAYEFLK